MKDVFKNHALEFWPPAMAVLGLTALALDAGYNGHYILEAGAAFTAGLAGGRIALEIKRIMDEQKPAL